LAAENTNNSTIDQLLESQNDPEEKWYI
jgi:hypothetical protein